MDNYPSNSDAAKSIINKPEREKPEKVVEGGVIRRKKPLGRRFADTFMTGDAGGVIGYIVNDILVPSVKELVIDVVTQGIERSLWGESRSRNRGNNKHSSNSSYVNYNRYSSQRRKDEVRSVSKRARSTHDFDEIVLSSRNEADDVLERLSDILSQFETATVGDLYELVGITQSYTDNKWGWTDLRSASISRVKHGYLLDLPRPEHLD